MDYSRIITIDPGKRSGKPCIRGLRITVGDVLDYYPGKKVGRTILSDSPGLSDRIVRPTGGSSLPG